MTDCSDETDDDRARRSERLSLGVVIRRQPGVTRWAKWVWRALTVVPGAGQADWQELRREGDVVDFHAATCVLELHRAETEAYRVALSNDPPSVYVILRPDEDPDSPHEMTVFGVTASAYEAQDYLDSGEEVVEAVPMPEALIAWVSAFVERHHVEENFTKRKRRRWVDERSEDGKGDARVRQTADVYRSPTGQRRGRLH